MTLALPCEAMHYANGQKGVTVILSRPLTLMEKFAIVKENPGFPMTFVGNDIITVQ